MRPYPTTTQVTFAASDEDGDTFWKNVNSAMDEGSITGYKRVLALLIPYILRSDLPSNDCEDAANNIVETSRGVARIGAYQTDPIIGSRICYAADRLKDFGADSGNPHLLEKAVQAFLPLLDIPEFQERAGFGIMFAANRLMDLGVDTRNPDLFIEALQAFTPLLEIPDFAERAGNGMCFAAYELIIIGKSTRKTALLDKAYSVYSLLLTSPHFKEKAAMGITFVASGFIEVAGKQQRTKKKLEFYGRAKEILTSLRELQGLPSETRRQIAASHTHASTQIRYIERGGGPGTKNKRKRG